MKLVFLNLFIAIILQGFDDTNDQQNRAFNNDMAEVYIDKWANFDPNGTGFIKIYNLPLFLIDLGKPLGWDYSYKDDKEKQEAFI